MKKIIAIRSESRVEEKILSKYCAYTHKYINQRILILFNTIIIIVLDSERSLVLLICVIFIFVFVCKHFI